MGERERILDVKSIVGVSLFAVASLGLVQSDLYIPPAVTLPTGIIYLYDKDNPQIRAHEEVHLQRYKDGDLDYWKYLTDGQYRCKEEQRANLEAGIFPIDDHPACN